MDVSGIAQAATSMQQTQLESAVQTALLRKALDMSAATALHLLQALPRVPTVNPPHLGANVDVKV